MKFTPELGTETCVALYSPLCIRVELSLEDIVDFDEESLVVELWSNLHDVYSSTGDWHALTMARAQPEIDQNCAFDYATVHQRVVPTTETLSFSVALLPTAIGSYEFTFRIGDKYCLLENLAAKHHLELPRGSSGSRWLWGGIPGQNSRVIVQPSSPSAHPSLPKDPIALEALTFVVHKLTRQGVGSAAAYAACLVALSCVSDPAIRQGVRAMRLKILEEAHLAAANTTRASDPQRTRAASYRSASPSPSDSRFADPAVRSESPREAAGGLLQEILADIRAATIRDGSLYRTYLQYNPINTSLSGGRINHLEANAHRHKRSSAGHRRLERLDSLRSPSPGAEPEAGWLNRDHLLEETSVFCAIAVLVASSQWISSTVNRVKVVRSLCGVSQLDATHILNQLKEYHAGTASPFTTLDELLPRAPVSLRNTLSSTAKDSASEAMDESVSDALKVPDGVGWANASVLKLLLRECAMERSASTESVCSAGSTGSRLTLCSVETTETELAVFQGFAKRFIDGGLDSMSRNSSQALSRESSTTSCSRASDYDEPQSPGPRSTLSPSGRDVRDALKDSTISPQREFARLSRFRASSSASTSGRGSRRASSSAAYHSRRRIRATTMQKGVLRLGEWASKSARVRSHSSHPVIRTSQGGGIGSTSPLPGSVDSSDAGGVGSTSGITVDSLRNCNAVESLAFDVFGSMVRETPLHGLHPSLIFMITNRLYRSPKSSLARVHMNRILKDLVARNNSHLANPQSHNWSKLSSLFPTQINASRTFICYRVSRMIATAMQETVLNHVQQRLIHMNDTNLTPEPGSLVGAGTPVSGSGNSTGMGGGGSGRFRPPDSPMAGRGNFLGIGSAGNASSGRVPPSFHTDDSFPDCTGGEDEGTGLSRSRMFQPSDTVAFRDERETRRTGVDAIPGNLRAVLDLMMQCATKDASRGLIGQQAQHIIALQVLRAKSGMVHPGSAAMGSASPTVDDDRRTSFSARRRRMHSPQMVTDQRQPTHRPRVSVSHDPIGLEPQSSELDGRGSAQSQTVDESAEDIVRPTLRMWMETSRTVALAVVKLSPLQEEPDYAMMLSCAAHLCRTCPMLMNVILSRILRKWPAGNSENEVALINFLAHVLKDAQSTGSILLPALKRQLVRRITKCLTSSHISVVKAGLGLCDPQRALLQHHLDDRSTRRKLRAALQENVVKHWNPSVREASQSLADTFFPETDESDGEEDGEGISLETPTPPVISRDDGRTADLTADEDVTDTAGSQSPGQVASRVSGTSTAVATPGGPVTDATSTSTSPEELAPQTPVARRAYRNKSSAPTSPSCSPAQTVVSTHSTGMSPKGPANGSSMVSLNIATSAPPAASADLKAQSTLSPCRTPTRNRSTSSLQSMASSPSSERLPKHPQAFSAAANDNAIAVGPVTLLQNPASQTGPRTLGGFAASLAIEEADLTAETYLSSPSSSPRSPGAPEPFTTSVGSGGPLVNKRQIAGSVPSLSQASSDGAVPLAQTAEGAGALRVTNGTLPAPATSLGVSLGMPTFDTVTTSLTGSGPVTPMTPTTSGVTIPVDVSLSTPGLPSLHDSTTALADVDSSVHDLVLAGIPPLSTAQTSAGTDEGGERSPPSTSADSLQDPDDRHRQKPRANTTSSIGPPAASAGTTDVTTPTSPLRRRHSDGGLILSLGSVARWSKTVTPNDQYTLAAALSALDPTLDSLPSPATIRSRTIPHDPTGPKLDIRDVTLYKMFPSAAVAPPTTADSTGSKDNTDNHSPGTVNLTSTAPTPGATAVQYCDRPPQLSPTATAVRGGRRGTSIASRRGGRKQFPVSSSAPARPQYTRSRSLSPPVSRDSELSRQAEGSLQTAWGDGSSNKGLGGAAAAAEEKYSPDGIDWEMAEEEDADAASSPDEGYGRQRWANALDIMTRWPESAPTRTSTTRALELLGKCGRLEFRDKVTVRARSCSPLTRVRARMSTTAADANRKSEHPPSAFVLAQVA